MINLTMINLIISVILLLLFIYFQFFKRWKISWNYPKVYSTYKNDNFNYFYFPIILNKEKSNELKLIVIGNGIQEYKNKEIIKVIKKDLWEIYDQTKQKYPIIIFKGYDKKNLYIRYLEGLDKNGLKVFYKINNFEYWEEWDIDHIQIIGTTIEK